MSEFPSLAEVIYRHRYWHAVMHCDCVKGVEHVDTSDRQEHAQHVADAWREACTIRTVEELDALPPDATVMSLVAIVAYQRARTPHRDWYSTGLSTIKSIDIPLPALLIWHPAWERP